MIKLGMSRSISRMLALCIMAIACLSMWELYYHMSVDEEQETNGVKERKVGKIRQNPAQNSAKKSLQVGDKKSQNNHLDFTKEQAKVQRKRKKIIDAACANVEPEDEINKYTMHHIYVVDQYKIAYCFVPKVGCSNWKRILMVLNGDRDSVDDLTSNEVHMHAKMKFLWEYNPTQQERILKDYHWFYFVREPLNRALSVYRNKFENYEYYQGNKFFHRFGKEIISKWRVDPSKEALETGANASWTEFVDYLTHPDERKKVENDWHFSDHWRETHKICSPCTINYDFIGKLETISTDAKYLLNIWGVDGKVSYLSSDTSRPTNSSSRSTYDKYFGQLGKDRLQRLWYLFKLDYALFDYPKPDIIP